MDNKLYHCCRWCKWFENGCCTNDEGFDTGDDLDFSPFYEDGTLSEAIKEGFTDFKFAELEEALIASKLSKVKRDEIMKVFREELETAQMNWTEEIDSQVSSALNHYDFDLDGRSIKDPHTFYCKNFW